MDRTQVANIQVAKPKTVEECAANLECWVDTVTAPGYVTVLVDKSFVVFKLTKNWNTSGSRGGHWLEVVALELAVRAVIALGHTKMHVRAYSQSRLAVQVFNGGKSAVDDIEESMGRLRCLLRESGVNMVCVQVASDKNLAHAFARGMVNTGYTKIACDVRLPVILMPLVEAVA
jgi:hypothetical protein